MNPWQLVADLLVLGGLAAQGWGVYALQGPELAAIVCGTEAALLGLLGVLRSAG